MEETYYSLLGVTQGATAAEIRAAYRARIREVHPDSIPNASPYWKSQAEERTKEVNEAYQVLSDPAKRREYDQQIEAYFRARGATSSSVGGSQSAPSQSARNAPRPPFSHTSRTAQRASAPTAVRGRSRYASGWIADAIFTFILLSFGIPAAVMLCNPAPGDEGADFLTALVTFLIIALFIIPDRIGKVLTGIGIRGRLAQKFCIALCIVVALSLVSAIGSSRQAAAVPASAAPPEPTRQPAPIATSTDPGSSPAPKPPLFGDAALTQPAELQHRCAFNVGADPCGSGAEVIADLRRGDRVETLSAVQRTTGGFDIYRVRTSEGWEGWINAEILSLDDPPASTAAEVPAYGNAIILQPTELEHRCAFNVGFEPCGSGAEEIADLRQGDRVETLSDALRTTGGFDIYRVRTSQGWEGWVNGAVVGLNPRQ